VPCRRLALVGDRPVRLETEGRGTGFARCGRVQPLADDAAIARARARAAEAAKRWGEAALWEVRAAGDFAAAAPESPSGMVVHDTLSARIDPPRAVAALADAVRARGGRILAEGQPAGPVIWATGAAGLGTLSRALGREAGSAVKGQAARLDHAAPGAPLVMAPGLLIVPHADGTTGVGATAEREFTDPDATDTALDAVIARAGALMPALRGAAVLRRWAGLRPRAAGGAPVLGPWPGHDGHFLANGGFRLGFALAPVVAGLMADLVLDGRDAIAPAFRPEAAVAGGRPAG